MTEQQFEAMKTTMPWQMVIHHSGVGGLVQMIDRNGQEVPLIPMCEFISVISQNIARQQSTQQGAAP